MCEMQEGGKSEDDVNAKVDLDTILVNEIGQFGKFQIRTLVLATVGVIFSAFHAEYVFTTARIPTRCLIPECESPSATEFAPPWLQHAVPTTPSGAFDECQRFNASLAGVEGEHPWNETCPATLFDASVRRDCDHHVYQNTHTVVYDFDLGCDEWRRSLIGFVRTFGTFASLPLTGYVSDRWGRRTALALNCFNTAWLGLVRYAASSYNAFIISQIVEAIFGSGVFSTTYILVLELVGPDYRVIAGGILSSCFALGSVLMGLIAWAIPDWRALTLALYIPQLITIGYFWVISESVRWYMSKGRYAQSEALLKEAARINKKPLSAKSLHLLRLTTEEEKKRKAIEESAKAQEPWLIILVFKHKQVLIRCMVLPLCWVTMTLTYYGLSINAVNMSGNQYVNYIAVSAVEIPGFWISVFLLSRIGRKPVMMGAYWVCAACQFAYVFMPTDMYALSLSVYLVGKCAISVAVTAIYVYTTELFPTRYRHNLFAYCSMVGRIGSFMAPLTPAIAAATFEEMPFVMFGSLALVAGGLMLLTPETRATKLPDTMLEAETLGTHEYKQ